MTITKPKQDRNTYLLSMHKALHSQHAYAHPPNNNNNKEQTIQQPFPIQYEFRFYENKSFKRARDFPDSARCPVTVSAAEIFGRRGEHEATLMSAFSHCGHLWGCHYPLEAPRIPPSGTSITHGVPCRAAKSASSGEGGYWSLSSKSQSPGQAECSSNPGWL